MDHARDAIDTLLRLVLTTGTNTIYTSSQQIECSCWGSSEEQCSVVKYDVHYGNLQAVDPKTTGRILDLVSRTWYESTAALR